MIEGFASVKRANRKVASLGPGEASANWPCSTTAPATVIADGPMTLFVLGSRQFAGVIEDVPSLSRKVMAALAKRIRELDSKIFH